MSDDAIEAWREVPAELVYRSIADAALRLERSAPATVGEITLHPHQQDAVHRLQVAMQTFGGALLADSVGLGKTYVALAAASRFTDVHIVAPANLLPMWRAAVARTASLGTRVHSLHSLSRRAIKNHNPTRSCLVVIDEAHHLRTRNTKRFQHAAQLTAGCTVLLLSATPLHNRARDLQNMLALFMGHRADSLDSDTLARCIVRRTAAHVPSVALPSVIEHSAHAVTDNPPVLEAILMLPAPLPLQDGAAAGALVRLGLLRAWCSSDAALTDTIRRRQLRGEALLHSLAHGRYPTHRELQSWIIGTDSIQLGFPELLVSTTTGDTAVMLATLTRHLDGLGRLLQLHTRTAVADPERAAMLRMLLDTRDEARPLVPVIAFSQFASTVRALHRALSDVAGVASLTSQGGRIASGPIARHDLIERFAPRAHSRPPPAVHERVCLLLTTDMLSEGVNLQDAGTLVHLDLPWTDAARAQRVGRLVRIGAQHDVVHVHSIAPPAGAERTLRIVDTLRRKARLSVQFVGADHSLAGNRSAAASAVECASRLRAHMLRWAALAGDGQCTSIAQPPVTLVSAVTASRSGWIAAVHDSNESLVLAHLHGERTPSDVCQFDFALTVMDAVDCIAGVGARDGMLQLPAESLASAM
ncbi:MAG: SNF2-related protein, partial [Gemmatimonadota bacterium]|nr:SNF2-related protein [Gemmatimonadota bacterium]